ncbi:MAG: hypothetical protein ACJ73Y_02170 [Rubrobacteraceae bacterium]|jgi:hypothetical protein
MKTSARGKVSYTLRVYRHKPPANYEMLRRIRSSAPTPEDISARLANNVSVPTSGGPPLLGSTLAVALVVAVAVEVAVAIALAVALAVGLAVDIAVAVAVLPPPPPP